MIELKNTAVLKVTLLRSEQMGNANAFSPTFEWSGGAGRESAGVATGAQRGQTDLSIHGSDPSGKVREGF
jgi:hypothetical protein